ncbi:MAG: iron ABC transporter permease [Clostridiales Family XIII bacterium]|nr:iron ABC transporter permease [Clostridiales Family XIII bacterium]
MKNFTHTRKAGYLTAMIALGVSLLVFAVLCICIGDYPVRPAEAIRIIFGKLTAAAPDWSAMEENVVIGLRVPRVIASVVVGAALSASGASFQGVFKNPLVSPDLLGVSSGACVGAAVAILLSLGSGYMQLFAFTGGIIAVLLTTGIPRMLRSSSNIMLVLSGIIVGGLMSSVLGFLKYIADPETELASIVYWQMGSFSYIDIRSLALVLPAIIVPATILIALSWRINILSLGEQEARSLGQDVPRLRAVILLLATLMTAGSVCISGTIGWVGLIIPHFARMTVGPSNTRLLPASMIYGGLFMLLVDTVTRTIGPMEMPVSILTGVIGAPFYAWLLYRQRAQLR